MTLQLKCAWCGRYLGEKKHEGKHVCQLKVSHGICPECLEKVLAEIEEYSNKTSKNNN